MGCTGGQCVKIPHLQSPRLTLRPYNAADLSAFATLNADEAVRQHVGGVLSQAEAERLFERFVSGECLRGHEAWAVTRSDTSEYIGHCWFSMREGADWPELGFLIAPRYWRRGYGTEVARTLIKYALGRDGYGGIIATVDPEHIACIVVLERAGMKRMREMQDKQGAYFVYGVMAQQTKKQK